MIHPDPSPPRDRPVAEETVLPSVWILLDVEAWRGKSGFIADERAEMLDFGIEVRAVTDAPGNSGVDEEDSGVAAYQIQCGIKRTQEAPYRSVGAHGLDVVTKAAEFPHELPSTLASVGRPSVFILPATVVGQLARHGQRCQSEHFVVAEQTMNTAWVGLAQREHALDDTTALRPTVDEVAHENHSCIRCEESCPIDPALALCAIEESVQQHRVSMDVPKNDDYAGWA